MELNELKEKIKEYLKQDVGDRIEKVKGSGGKEFNYLSWAWCFTEVMKIDANFQYKVLENTNGMPYWFDEDLGYIVKTEMTILGITRTMWLPVMDARNCAMKNKPYEVKTKTNTYRVESATMFDVNKAIMRCLVKNVAVCIGLGLYIYAGEDVPEAMEEKPKETSKISENKGFQIEEKEIITKEAKTPKKAQEIVNDSDLPFELEMDDRNIKEEKANMQILERLRDTIVSKLYQLGYDDLPKAMSYYAKKFNKETFEDLKSDELATIIDKLDATIKQRKGELQ